MTIDDVRLPAEGCPLVGQRLEVVGVGRARALLESVAVNDCGQAAQAALGRIHGCLPVAALLKFTVTEDDKRSPWLAHDLGRGSTPDTHRKTMPQRARVGFDARHLATVRVAVERRQRGCKVAQAMG